MQCQSVHALKTGLRSVLAQQLHRPVLVAWSGLDLGAINEMVRPPGQIEVGRFVDHTQYSDVALLGGSPLTYGTPGWGS